MSKFFSWFLGLPVAVAIVFLSVANRHSVRFSLYPATSSESSMSFDMPLYLLLLAAAALGIAAGGAGSWLGHSKWRRAAREARREASELRSETPRPKTEDGNARRS